MKTEKVTPSANLVSNPFSCSTSYPILSLMLTLARRDQKGPHNLKQEREITLKKKQKKPNHPSCSLMSFVSPS